MRKGGKEGKKEGRKEGKKGGREEGRKERREGGRKEGRKRTVRPSSFDFPLQIFFLTTPVYFNIFLVLGNSLLPLSYI